MGGAGYGDPLERDPEAVLSDVLRNFITEQVARDVYKVDVDAVNGRIDAAATGELRASERAARLKRGRPYDAFVADWIAKRPPAGILEWFGSWPEGKPERAVMRP